MFSGIITNCKSMFIFNLKGYCPMFAQRYLEKLLIISSANDGGTLQ